jgi:hypothetical protein
MSVWGDKLDAAKSGAEFGAALGGLFASLDAARWASDEDEEDDEDE